MSNALRLRQFLYSIFSARFIELQRGQASSTKDAGGANPTAPLSGH
ncbi:hypothetical protein [Paraburkholderia sp. J67]|nr:hypothetical protein [Paraburkholderia sp. J67]